MAGTSAQTVANHFVELLHDQGGISNLKLQKLLYYAQAWHLALYGEPLFRDRIEAWVHGPVVPPVFGAFKHNKWQPYRFHGRLGGVAASIQASSD